MNDPLADMTPWQIYQRCIWISDEDTNTKISLLCLSRFMDKDLRAASMSYAQWARDCGFSERTAKRCAQVAASTWLRVGVGKGRYVPGKGHENRYDGVIPQKWADELRRRMRNGIEVKPDEDIVKAVDNVISGKTGVSEGHPEQRGVTHRHPETPISGCQAGTGVSGSPVRGVRESHVLQIPLEEREEGADAPVDAMLPLEGGAAQNPKDGARAEPAKKRAATPATYRGTRWPKGQAVPDEWRAWVAREYRVTSVDIRREADAFADYWPAKAGKDAAKLDWEGTWRNWCRRAFKGKEAIVATAANAHPDRGAALDAQLEQRRQQRRGRS